jgi:thymidine phosphorylase
MAVFFNGMTDEECGTLTGAMTRSGDVMDWSDLNLDRPVLDKHSTGGVGDNVSLILAPLIAAAGGAVPMISGRGLGHTGGTLDKLETIPGYQAVPDTSLFRDTVRDVGCAIIGQTGNLAPADKRLYAVRDVTATVESIPLITASILSKKMAAGLDGLVMDVKLGNGAFAATPEFARALATNLVNVAKRAGLATHALITDMNEPLATAAGNAVEVRNAVEFLTGAHRDARLQTVVLALAAEMMVVGKLDSDVDTARARARDLLDTGAASEHFAKMVAALGGPKDLMENLTAHLATAPVVRPVLADKTGWINAVDTRQIGLVVVELGGGRRRVDDVVDPAVGLTDLCGIGEEVTADRPLAMIHARDDEAAMRAERKIRAAYAIGETQPTQPDPVIYDIVSEASS